MVNILRRFSQPIMILVSVIVVITFAWWTPSWYAKSGRDSAVTVIRGKSVNMEEWQREGRIMKIHAMLGGEYWRLVDPTAAAEMEREFQRNMREGRFVRPEQKVTPEGVENSLLFGGEAAALGVSASQDEIERQLAETPAFMGTDGKFDANKFEIIAQRVLMPEGFSKTQIEQFMAAEVRARKIAALLASTIPPTPAEVKDEFIRERLTTEASYVVVKTGDFRAAQKATEDEIKQRYEAKKDFLKSPEKRKVRFAAFTLPPEPASKPEDEAKKTPEEKQAAETKKTEQLQELANKAYDFVTALQKPGVNFDEAAKQAGATLGETAEFFPIDAGPAELEGSADAAKAAFVLTKEKPYSAHIPLAKGTYVLAFKEVKEPEQLPLEKVRKDIEEELVAEKADTAMMEKARTLREKIAEARKAGKSFTEAAESLGVKAVAFPAYSLMQRVPPETPYAQPVQAAAAKLAPGEVSDVVPTAGAALIVHVDQRPAVDEKDMQQATARIAEGIQSSRQMIAFQAWLMDRREAAGLKPPKER